MCVSLKMDTRREGLKFYSFNVSTEKNSSAFSNVTRQLFMNIWVVCFKFLTLWFVPIPQQNPFVGFHSVTLKNINLLPLSTLPTISGVTIKTQMQKHWFELKPRNYDRYFQFSFCERKTKTFLFTFGKIEEKGRRWVKGKSS
jgi:hypothetical protein